MPATTMCGRFTLTDPDRLDELFRVPFPDDIPARFNVAPSQPHPIVHRAGDGRACRIMRWGLVPYWAGDPTIGNRLINARAESAGTRNAFRAAFAERRCLVPVDGFYEWQTSGGRRRPVWIHRQDRAPFALGGLYERWRDRRDGGELWTFAILTTDASEAMVDYHDRQPLVVPPEAFDRWLDPSGPPGGGLLEPAPLEAFAFTPVSTYVNSPKNDDARCLYPAVQPSLF